VCCLHVPKTHFSTAGSEGVHGVAPAKYRAHQTLPRKPVRTGKGILRIRVYQLEENTQPDQAFDGDEKKTDHRRDAFKRLTFPGVHVLCHNLARFNPRMLAGSNIFTTIYFYICGHIDLLNRFRKVDLYDWRFCYAKPIGPATA
jgi:hypothetical protein